jgi:hypothetical protein
MLIERLVLTGGFGFGNGSSFEWEGRGFSSNLLSPSPTAAGLKEENGGDVGRASRPRPPSACGDVAAELVLRLPLSTAVGDPSKW